jgi:hypothetical protein
MRQRGAAMGAEFKGKGGTVFQFMENTVIHYQHNYAIGSSCRLGTHDELDASTCCRT